MISYFASPDLIGQLLTFNHRREAGERVRILLAEGDSWFSLGGLTTNLLMALDDDDTLIVSCASPGDTMRNMSSLGNEPFWMMLSPRFGVQWDGVLLSAGGNDLLGDVGRVISGGNLDLSLLDAALNQIDNGYQRIVASVREHHACPIHAHTYDYPVPDPGGWLRLGPWVGNRLRVCGVPVHRHQGIIIHLIDALAEHLHRNKNLTVHDTRGTLTGKPWRCVGWQKHYINEIHPSAAGYRLLADKWRVPSLVPSGDIPS